MHVARIISHRRISETSRQTHRSIVRIADVAIEADIDLPCPALRLHEIGQHGIVALATASMSLRSTCMSPATSSRKARSSMVVILRSAMTTRPSTITVSTPRPPSVNTTWRATLLSGTKDGSVRSRMNRSAAMPGRNAPIRPSKPAVRAPPTVADQIASAAVGGPGSGCVTAASAGEQLHRLEHVLGIAAAAIVAAQRHSDALAQIGADRRNAAAGLEVADGIEHDVGAGFRDGLDLRGRHPDAVGKVHPRRQQPHAAEIIHQRAAVRGVASGARSASSARDS